MKRITLLLLFITSVFFTSCSSADQYKISPVEAIHLVEIALKEKVAKGHFNTTGFQQTSYKDNPAYKIYGNVDQDRYHFIVDAQVARVMEITKNGETIFSWNKILVVGHRGNVKFAPENTIAAFEIAIKYGADLIEMDIRETRDGELVVIHDHTVDRTTDGSGKVSDKTLQEIKELDAGSWFSQKFKGERVPTFIEALDAIEGRALPDIDFKAGTPSKLIEILKEKKLLGKVTLYCGNWDLMREVIQLSPDGFLIRPTVPVGDIGLPIVLKELDPQIININWEEFSERLVRNAHLIGKKSFINTMQHDNRLAMQFAIDTAPDYIQSDHIDVLMPLLRAKGLHE